MLIVANNFKNVNGFARPAFQLTRHIFHFLLNGHSADISIGSDAKFHRETDVVEAVLFLAVMNGEANTIDTTDLEDLVVLGMAGIQLSVVI